MSCPACAAPLWTKVDSTVYSLAYVFGFIVSGAFILLFLLLIIFQSAVRENHRRSRRSRYPEGLSLSLDCLASTNQICSCHFRGKCKWYETLLEKHCSVAQRVLLMRRVSQAQLWSFRAFYFEG